MIKAALVGPVRAGNELPISAPDVTNRKAVRQWFHPDNMGNSNRMSNSDSTDQTLAQIRKLWATLDRKGRERHLTWTLSQCATCGRRGESDGNGIFCDACCDERMREMNH